MIAQIIAQVIEWIIAQLARIGLAELKRIEHDQEISKKAEEDKKKIEGAITDEDRAKAGSNSAHDTFG